MKKRYTFFLCFALIAALCLTLSSCSVSELYDWVQWYGTHSDYTLVTEGERMYIIYDGPQYEPNHIGQEEIPHIEFSSVKEMKNSIIQKTLTEQEKQELSKFSRDEEGNIPICNLNDLYVPLLPEGEIRYMEWLGEEYKFSLNSDKGDHYGTLEILPKEAYNKEFSHEYQDIFENENKHITNTETVGNKTITNYYVTVQGFTEVQTKLTAENKVFYIMASYSGTLKNEAEISAATPYSIKCYCEEGTQRYIIYLSTPSAMPSEEWFLAFGLEKFENHTSINK